MATEFCYNSDGGGTTHECKCTKLPEFKLPEPPTVVVGVRVQGVCRLIIGGVVAGFIILFVILVVAIAIRKRRKHGKDDTVMLNSSKLRTDSQSGAQYNMHRTNNPVYDQSELDSGTKQNSRIRNSPRLSELFPVDGQSPPGTNTSGDSGFVDNANTLERPSMAQSGSTRMAQDDFPLNKMPSSQDEETVAGFARGDGMLWRNKPPWQQGVHQRTAMI